MKQHKETFVENLKKTGIIDIRIAARASGRYTVLSRNFFSGIENADSVPRTEIKEAYQEYLKEAIKNAYGVGYEDGWLSVFTSMKKLPQEEKGYVRKEADLLAEYYREDGAFKIQKIQKMETAVLDIETDVYIKGLFEGIARARKDIRCTSQHDSETQRMVHIMEALSDKDIQKELYAATGLTYPDIDIIVKVLRQAVGK